MREPGDERAAAESDMDKRVGTQRLYHLNAADQVCRARSAGCEMLGPDTDRDPAARSEVGARRDATAAGERPPAGRLGLPGEQIHRPRADEARNERALRVLVGLHPRADLLGAAAGPGHPPL